MSFGIFNSPKKRTKKFDFTTMVLQFKLFSFFFCENWRHQTDILKLTDLYLTHSLSGLYFSLGASLILKNDDTMVRVEPIVTILSVEREIYDAFISRLQLKSLQFQSFFFGIFSCWHFVITHFFTTLSSKNGPKCFWLGKSSVWQTSKNILQKVKIISCFI